MSPSPWPCSRRRFLALAATAAAWPALPPLAAQVSPGDRLRAAAPLRGARFGLVRDGAPLLLLDAFDVRNAAGLPVTPNWRPAGANRLVATWPGMQAELSLAAAPAAGADVHRLEVNLQAESPEARLTWFGLRFLYLPEEPARWAECPSHFHWLPNLKQQPGDVAGEHTFRAPAAVVTSAARAGVALVPDLAAFAAGAPARQFLDLDLSAAGAPALGWGVGAIKPVRHFYYRASGEGFALPAGGWRFAACVLVGPPGAFPAAVNRFLWSRWGTPLLADRRPLVAPLATYAKYGYEPALAHLWRPGPAPGTGGITNVTLRTPEGKFSGRRFRDDLWFQCWFNGVRTAWGLASWGRRLGRAEWVERARDTVRLALAAPRTQGFFPAVYAPHDGGWKGSGVESGGTDRYHLPDMAWTALWLRKFHEEIEPVAGTPEFLADFAAGLLRVQDRDGGFPTWLARGSLGVEPALRGSASGALPAWFLGEELAAGRIAAAEQERARDAVRRATRHLRAQVMPGLRFDDFELYLSCSRKPFDFFDRWTTLPGINTLALQWCAEAFRVAHVLGLDPAENLAAGRACLELLCLFQQVWNPPFLSLYAFGGFGVMNTDAEWNDARQAQFAETFANWHRLTGEAEWKERAVAAARSAFALLVCEEHRAIAPRTYRGQEKNFEVHGMMAENYGHDGTDNRAGQSSFHWGTGSALTAAARLANWLEP